MKLYHHHNVPIFALALALIGIVQYRTNVQSLAHEVRVEQNSQTNTSFVSATLVTQETTFHVEKLLETSKQSCLGHITGSLSTSTKSTT
jgi:hypothetical protein